MVGGERNADAVVDTGLVAGEDGAEPFVAGKRSG